MINKEIYNVDNTHENAEIIQITRKAWNLAQNRLNELEESVYHNAMSIERLEKINEYESNIDDVITKTADQMFTELGYKHLPDKFLDWELYKKDSDDTDYEFDVIKIHSINKSYYKVSIYMLKAKATPIDENEAKAIHKRIEELKKNKTEEIGYNCWIIYTDDPQFEGKRMYFKSFFKQRVNFTDEKPNAKKYPSFTEALKDMNILKNKYGLECFTEIIASRKYPK